MTASDCGQLPKWGIFTDRNSLSGDYGIIRFMNEKTPAIPAVPPDLVPFADRPAALTVLNRMSASYREKFDRILPRLITSLGLAADPDRSLVYFERFAEGYGARLFDELEKNPRVIEILATLFSASRFLTEILLRSPESFSILLSRQRITERKSIELITAEAKAAYEVFPTFSEQKDALRRYQRNELLRIGTGDFLGLFDLRSVLSQLSRMAIGLVRACLSLAEVKSGCSSAGFVVLALGKLGGYELNYSSDIDLLFIARENPDRFLALAQRLIEIISIPSPEGFLYRVDLRLRPWGNDGPLISELPAYGQYIETSARLWEKQALLKVRPIAGDLSLGEEFRREIEPRIYRVPAEQVRASILAMKQKTEEFLRQSGREWGEVKLGVGSIRDIEFVVQSLQMTHPHIMTRATLKAIPRLQKEGLITATDGRVLTDGYIFLRTIEHYLQMLDYHQTNTLPSDPVAIGLLARRLGFEGYLAGEKFISRYEEHCEAIRAVFMHYIGSDIPPALPLPEVEKHLERMDASYTGIFSPAEIHRHVDLAAELDENCLARVEALPLKEGQWQVTVVAYDYPGELSILCGLLFVYGLNILDGNAFTYEPLENDSLPPETQQANPRRRNPLTSGEWTEKKRKLVDVFTVKPVHPDREIPWDSYSQDLNNLVRKMQDNRSDEARGELARLVGSAFQSLQGEETTLMPIDIEIDNRSSNRYTVLQIDAQDTLGFLYELTNALALYPIYIARVFIRSVGRHVQDTLYVTDDQGQKINDPGRQQKLRSAIVLIKHFTHLLPRSPNPESALLHFREFLFKLFQRPDWDEEVISIERPVVLNALARLLGVSDFLWEDFLRMQYANLFPVVKNVENLNAARSRPQLEAELAQIFLTCQMGDQVYSDWITALNAFKDRELFRIDMRHILGLTEEFWDFSAELTILVEVVLQAAYRECYQDLGMVHGMPTLETGLPCPFVLFALGKCGGSELGFASDIELMFLYGGGGETTGPDKISNAAFFERLVNAFSKAIHARQESIFQIDLQLRPYGKAGSLAVSLEAFKRYYALDGPAWAYERQALVKLRPVAGDEVFAREIRDLRDQYVYRNRAFDVVAMRAMRERQVRHLVTGGTFNAKFSPGGLVDIEYLIQGLQIKNGAENPELRSTNIREAMASLHAAGILADEDYIRLKKAHTFFRWLIDSLRVVRGNAKDITIPPFESDEFAFLTRRLLYGIDSARLREDLTRYAEEVLEINTRLLP
jgi:[glutamine synthetase] adenylyltransferase / [glutamine synthetase]-adenylyl-L-tyrosine phosphorylase